jgi:predicted metal-dependent phosphoesterase TrpH
MMLPGKNEKTLIKADLHIHTTYSPDSLTSLEKVIARCKERDIKCVAITDHNVISGALKLRERAPFTVIIGEEIRTNSGEMIGYFLSERVPPNLSPEETAQRIKAQGGLVCIPHPFARTQVTLLPHKVMTALVPHIDIIEVCNARNMFSRHNTTARLFASAHKLAGSAGSDAHTAREIGNAYVQITEFNGAEEFRLALARGTPFCHKASPLAQASGIWIRLVKRVKPDYHVEADR